MKGSIQYRKDRGTYRVAWYNEESGKTETFPRYHGETIRDKRYAEKLLAKMQDDFEEAARGNGTFRLEKYRGQDSDVVEYLSTWIDTFSKGYKPGTIVNLKSYYRCIWKPFFTKNSITLNRINLDVLSRLKAETEMYYSPTGAFNVMGRFMTFLKWCVKSDLIPGVPIPPEKKQYGIIKKQVKWLNIKEFQAVMTYIPKDEAAPFYFIYYHLLRPAEACAIQWRHYDELSRVFYIQQTLSSDKVVETTKTGEIYITPCQVDFEPYIKELVKTRTSDNDYIFRNPRAKRTSGRYGVGVLRDIWNKARDIAYKKGEIKEKINLYSGLKHSRASQMVNENGMNEHDVFMAGPWKDPTSVKKYVKVDIERKRELLNSTIIESDNKVIRGTF